MDDYTSLDFINGVEKIKNAKKKLDSNISQDIISKEEQLIISEFLFRKVAQYYKFKMNTLEKTKNVLKNVYPSVRDYRYAFMHYNFYYDPMMLELADHYFFKEIYNEFSATIILGQFLARFGNDEIVKNTCDKLEKIFTKESLLQSQESFAKKSTIADIFLRINNSHYRQIGNKMLNDLREHTNTTIYEDNQNVHNETLANNIFNVLSNINLKLLEHFKTKIPPIDFDQVYKEFLKLMNDYVDEQLNDFKKIGTIVSVKMNFSNYTEETLYRVFERLKHDPASVRGYTLDSTFTNIYIFIKSFSKKYQTQKFYRLIEELIEGVDYCASGYIARMTNSFQGFDDVDDDFIIKIDDKEDLKAKIYKFLQDEIMNNDNSDELLSSLTSPNEILCKFIQSKIDDFLKNNNEIEIIDIVDIVNQFLNKKVFYTFENKTLCFNLNEF